MPRKSQVMEKILELQDLLVSQDSNASSLQRLNMLIANLKTVGLIEGVVLNGEKATYLIIDGESWRDTCQRLHAKGLPNFVMWEEGEFVSFLQSQLTHRR